MGTLVDAHARRVHIGGVFFCSTATTRQQSHQRQPHQRLMYLILHPMGREVTIPPPTSDVQRPPQLINYRLHHTMTARRPTAGRSFLGERADDGTPEKAPKTRQHLRWLGCGQPQPGFPRSMHTPIIIPWSMVHPPICLFLGSVFFFQLWRPLHLPVGVDRLSPPLPPRKSVFCQPKLCDVCNTFIGTFMIIPCMVCICSRIATRPGLPARRHRFCAASPNFSASGGNCAGGG